MGLESYLRKKLREKDILIMTHIVLGYPSFEDCYRIVEVMVEEGVDLMELQIPFSEPLADGPVILRANHRALQSGAAVQKCLNFARRITMAFEIPFVIMSYYNIPFKYGIKPFVSAMAESNLRGAIIPDLPPEEGREYVRLMRACELAPIFIFSPTTPDDRLQYIASFAHGFIYCVARKGVTGSTTNFSDDLVNYVARCRKATHLPLALGFGITEKKDITFIKGKADVAVIGTQTIRIIEREGINNVGGFIRSLR
jgi:tryptophan synthase alpha chain